MFASFWTILRIFAIFVAFEWNLNVAEQKDLNIMGFLPMTGTMFRGGPACLLATNMAIDHVNEREDILEGFRLNLVWRDSKCDAGAAVNALYEMLYSSPTKQMIFGPGCSTEAEVLAQAAPAWNITTLSWGASSPLLSDHVKFPRFFRVVAPETRANIAKVELARLFGWKKIATLNVALDHFSAVTDNLVQLVKQNDISIISQEIYDQDPLSRIQSLKDKDARIIMTAGYASHAKLILCAAYKAGLYGPKVVWLFPGYYRELWWEKPVPETSCTIEQMALVAEGSILTSFFFASNKIERGIANLTVPEYWDLYYQDEYYEQVTDYEYVSPLCYDAIWAIALALNCTDTILQSTGHNKSLDEFSYSDVDIGDIMTSCTRNVSYLGLSGHVEFDSSGEPRKNVKIDQIQNGMKTLVGIFRTEGVEEPSMEWYNGGFIWKDGVPPRDSTLVKEVEDSISLNVYVTMSGLAGLGMVLAISLIAFNVIHRENKYVKLSSPNINNVLLLGCIITYSSVFMESCLTEYHESAIICKMKTCTFCIGFTVAFGALFSKTWRVYKIFSNKKMLQVRIKDYQLISLVLALVGVLCLVLVIWGIVDPLYLEKRKLEKEVYLIGNDAELHPHIYVCTSNYYSYFSWTICIIEGALLSFGAFLSFETRKVKIEALNDSQYIGMCLYNVVVLSAVGLTLSLVLTDRITLLYGITSTILILGTTASQLLVFIPKITAVYYPNRVRQEDQSSFSRKHQNTNLPTTSRAWPPTLHATNTAKATPNTVLRSKEGSSNNVSASESGKTTSTRTTVGSQGQTLVKETECWDQVQSVSNC